jgi:glycosyltransferase involved in cell wall biosynthesis
MRRAPLRLKRAVARTLRTALIAYARAKPRPSDREGADRRVFIFISAAWGMGGTIRTTLNLAGYLASQGYEVEMISLGRGRDKPFFGAFPPGVHVVALEDKRASARRGPLHRLLASRSSVLVHPRERVARGSNLWTDLALVRRLRRRCGYLITTRPGLNILAADLAPPGLVLIGQEHMNLPEHPKELRRAMPKRYPDLDVLAVLTEGDREAYDRHLGGGVPVVRIPNTIRDMGAPGADLASKLILTAGRLTPQKGYDMLIPAFAQVAARHPGWHLRICGDGPQQEKLERLIDEHGLQEAVTLSGPAKDLGAEMSRASIFVLSSRFEGLPLVLLEAMGQGMAVVSFDCPTGPADVLADHHNGLLIPPKDVDALAAGLLEMVEDEDLRRRCAAAAVETAREYSMDAVGPQWEELLRRFAPKRTKRLR